MANLDAWRRQLQNKAARVADVVANQAVQELRAGAPIDTGALRSMITAQVRTYARGATVTIESGAPYDIYVDEFREDWDRMLRRLPSMIEQAWRSTP